MARIEGESAQAKGADGARRAKRWLESTTRVSAQWVNPDPPAVKKLRFTWPHGGQNFSFDLGGFLKHGDYDGEMFFAESKNYATPSDLPDHYSKFLAQCYVAYLDKPSFCDHFMWVAWSPHSINQWPNLMSEGYVRKHVLKHRDKVFGVESEEEARPLIDDDAVSAVAKRLWLIILSEKQETLVISKEHRGVIDKYETGKDD
ncbi:hypothetical protein [Agromyces cerinus]|uniref:Uncharacterized protein n=1 Tax=Agromyces cerinus subsp. cerinus TaxID=232089 RepID=A0A1N6I4W5_9MICO|nr:hypothetical protein [Agromyces cerinus]SIO27062.1 hypothetical protein SAMN05443544_3681 [Agromyces cerinus subsp. cerinus]